MANFISKLIKPRHLLIPPTFSAPQFKKVTPYMDFKLVDQTAVTAPPFFPVLFCYLSEFHMIRKNAKSLQAYVQSYFMLSQVFHGKLAGSYETIYPPVGYNPQAKCFFWFSVSALCDYHTLRPCLLSVSVIVCSILKIIISFYKDRFCLHKGNRCSCHGLRQNSSKSAVFFINISSCHVPQYLCSGTVLITICNEL